MNTTVNAGGNVDESSALFTGGSTRRESSQITRKRKRRSITMWTMLSVFCILLASVVITAHTEKSSINNSRWDKFRSHPAVLRFQEYLRIDTSGGKNLEHAVKFWKRQASDTGLIFNVYEPAGKPIIVMTWEGLNPHLPSIMLNSHMDVVPANAVEWQYPPFEAHIDEYANIYARGTQDTKDVGIQYMEAIRILLKNKVRLQRTIHVTVMPDEETGGHAGMEVFVKSPTFEALNVSFALDEGLSSLGSHIYATYTDKRPWQFRAEIHGNPGHSYTIPDNTAVEKAAKLIHTITKFREEQKAIYKLQPVDNFSAFTSVNINIINGGYATNVIPASINITVDMRLAEKADAEEMQRRVNSWAVVAGSGTQLVFTRQVNVSGVTAHDESNPYYVCMRNTLAKMGISLRPIVCPATSDMLKVRNVGIPALGFAPKTYTKSRIHGANEYLNVGTYIKGIEIYVEVIKSLGNLL